LTLDMRALDRAEVELERQYGVPSFVIVEGEQPDNVPEDVARWWRAADRRRRQLIDALPRGPLYVTDAVEPMELRKDRLRKPGPPR
jgi:hypothetical protein